MERVVRNTRVVMEDACWQQVSDEQTFELPARHRVEEQYQAWLLLAPAERKSWTETKGQEVYEYDFGQMRVSFSFYSKSGHAVTVERDLLRTHRRCVVHQTEVLPVTLPKALAQLTPSSSASDASEAAHQLVDGRRERGDLKFCMTTADAQLYDAQLAAFRAKHLPVFETFAWRCQPSETAEPAVFAVELSFPLVGSQRLLLGKVAWTSLSAFRHRPDIPDAWLGSGGSTVALSGPSQFCALFELVGQDSAESDDEG